MEELIQENEDELLDEEELSDPIDDPEPIEEIFHISADLIDSTTGNIHESIDWGNFGIFASDEDLRVIMFISQETAGVDTYTATITALNDRQFVDSMGAITNSVTYSLLIGNHYTFTAQVVDDTYLNISLTQQEAES